MRKGWSLYQCEGQWREEVFSEVALSDQSLVIELERDDDTVTVTTASTDGVRYRGDFRYREGSNSNGEVYFDRYQGPKGDVFVGEWKESDKSQGEWIIKVLRSE